MNKTKVLLLNIDSKLPNIALKKIEMFHQQQGDEVIWDMPMMLGQADKAYASCIFTKNKVVLENYKGLYPELIVGGTGYEPSITLPPEIEAMKPKINYGFTTRGCIRHCEFCLVPQAEGDIHIVGDIYDIWDDKSKLVTLLDNNILALPTHFMNICQQTLDENLTVDFNQGLDLRLVTQELGLWLSRIKTPDLRFAFDHPRLERVVREKVEMLRTIGGLGRKAYFFYVLVGFDTTFEEDLHRAEVLKELGCRAYIMKHANTPKEKRYQRLAEWCNQFWTFVKFDFETFCVEYEKK